MKKSNIRLKYLMNIDSFIPKKEYTLLFLISILAIIPPILSGYQSSNFLQRLLNVIESPLSNILFFLEIIILTNCILMRVCYNPLFLSRYTTYKDLIKNGVLTIIISTIILYLSFFLVASAGSIIFSFGNYQLSIYEQYHINIIFYIIFKLIKNIVIYSIISVFILYIFIYFKNIIPKCCIIVLNIACFFISPSKSITRIFKAPILFQNYLIAINYSSFYLEITTFILYVICLILILQLLYGFMIKRKRIYL